MSVERVLSLLNNSEAPATARQAVSNALSAWEYPESVTEAARLLTSELVTNAVRHSPALPRVTVHCVIEGDTLTLKVFDGSSTIPMRRTTVPEDAESGRGLNIVEYITAEHGGHCGVNMDVFGKWVVATLKVAPIPSHVERRELAALGVAS
ncbi:ATP-binding protein [Streptomyces sp. MBT56]|uniref:ATP-binding protein n=1 Tax=unclassified Streptomyces TaxID=2593676 RepID=UPI00190B24F5|nr:MULTISPECIES: ATP-binding protein [unclassified Streptomyces]MBK3559301.1 ATP-binding protein [Streptomyces sp. MBT56]MBK3601024.1 ATP-binding protein [Streptomyces sp. MBT54]MBK3613930.1 ATP-binding protein [Streptomyces sp. MBT98]MBK6042005.1 ATP-binding protein [Streptomyces sp. MBT55]